MAESPGSSPSHQRTPATLGLVRAFNNNVVVARDDAGREYILMGKGIGFNAKAHTRIASSSAERIFRPAEGDATERIVSLLSELAPEHIEAAQAIAELAQERLGYTLADSLVIPLADHLALADQRASTGQRMQLPLVAEMQYAFPAEHAVAQDSLPVVAQLTGVQLHADEAAAIALHLVNASHAGDMSSTFHLAATLSDALLVVERTFGSVVDPTSVAVARFATHLRYLLTRLQTGTQQTGSSTYMWKAAKASHPDEHACAVEIGRIVSDRLGVTITQDEELYLTLHVMRLVAHG